MTLLLAAIRTGLLQPEDKCALAVLVIALLAYALGRWHGMWVERRKSMRSVKTIQPNRGKKV